MRMISLSLKRITFIIRKYNQELFSKFLSLDFGELFLMHNKNTRSFM